MSCFALISNLSLKKVYNFNKKCVVAFFLSLSFISKAAAQTEYADSWYVQSHSTGVLARVARDESAKPEFMIAFEFRAKCAPIFSIVKAKYLNSNALGAFVQRINLGSDVLFLQIRGAQYSGYAVRNDYDYGYEAGFALSAPALQALVTNSKDVVFVGQDGVRYPIPGDDLSSAIREAASLCQQLLR